MNKSRILLAAGTAALTLGVAACGGGGGASSSSSTGGGGGGNASAPVANAAIGKVYRPSDTKGGTLRFGAAGDWDSVDPGDTYYGLSWNFLRNYARTLVVFKAAPGGEGTKLVPDLATSLGKPSDGNKTWTYTLRDGLKFEDGDARLEQPKIDHQGTDGRFTQRLECGREGGAGGRSEAGPDYRAADLRHPTRPQRAEGDVNRLGTSLPETELDDVPCVHGRHDRAPL